MVSDNAAKLCEDLSNALEPGRTWMSSSAPQPDREESGVLPGGPGLVRAEARDPFLPHATRLGRNRTILYWQGAPACYCQLTDDPWHEAVSEVRISKIK